MRLHEQILGFIVVLCISIFLVEVVNGEDPYKFFDWDVTYGVISPLGVPQKGILINGQFPGPEINAVTNDNIIINVHNGLTEPFLISWNGVLQRKNSWQDGVYGTNCPIPPGGNYTYVMQFKDQIGSFFYFPSLAFQKAAGGFGAISIVSRLKIPVPFDDPAGDYSILVGDWYRANYTKLQNVLDSGKMLKFPDAILINGQGTNRAAVSFNVEKGKTYRFRISNVGLQNTINFRIQGHTMKLVEVEGTHTQQNSYTSLDIHIGQSYSVLVTADQPPNDYYIAVSTRFTSTVLMSTAILHYTTNFNSNSNSNNNTTNSSSQPLPDAPTDVIWSLNQARSIRTNLTASGPRPNPQGSYHYGLINVSRTIQLANSAGLLNGKQRYAVNSVSFVPADTPLKLADHFKIEGVFRLGSIGDNPTTGAPTHLDTSVMAADFRDFIEIVFQNKESIVQSWHLDGYFFFVVGMDQGKWSPAARDQYNLIDAITRSTVQVYPRSWTAIYVALDNVGMWNLRSQFWARRYLGQEFYLSVYSPVESTRDQYLIPTNALLCGRATAHESPTF